MTRILLIVAMLLAVSPAMGVTITAVDEGGGVVRVGYADGNGIRAFALDITLDNGATFTSISDYKTGESNSASPGFGIFPGRFRDYIAPANPNWSDVNYSPVAPVGDPDNNDTGLGGNYITVELGSLYSGDANKPLAAGTLFKLHCTGNGDANLCVKLNATRGNVVKEDATEAAVTLPGTGGCLKVMFECMLSTNPTYAQWKVVKSPNCWCFGFVPRQCHGDADGKAEGRNNYWASTGDLNVLIAAWNKTFAQIDGQSYNGVPLICADFDHNSEGRNSYRVAANDLNILITNWNKVNKPDPNCPQ